MTASDCPEQAAKRARHGDALAESLNRDCQCISIDAAALRQELAVAMADDDVLLGLIQDRPHLYAASAVFVSRQHVQRMAEVVAAVESVVALPAYRDWVLQWAPPAAQYDPGTPGVYLGYDFHLGPAGPQLIEINTNAGGGLLNLFLARAQRACCKEMTQRAAGPVPLEAIESGIIAMFRAEWSRRRGAQPLRTVAIVDDAPTTQYLYPEFLLFQRLFRQHGWDCVIADAAALRLQDGMLFHGERPIDLVYNRLTDFPLSEPAHAALQAAYLADRVVVTPHPRAHALYADKRNLIPLTNAQRLRSWGVAESTITTLLQGIPPTIEVTAALAGDLWTRRRELFFKPTSGYGGKAAYRGDKITRRAWNDILQGSYVAQALVTPSARRLRVGDRDVDMKLDLRNFVYAGQVQLLAARLYQGQTTNFRTQGGGFAAVFCPD